MLDSSGTELPAQSLRSRIAHLPRMVRLALATTYAAARRLLVLTVVLQVISAITLVVQLLASRSLFSHLVGKTDSTSDLIPVTAALLGAFAVSAIITVSGTGLQHLLAERVSEFAMRRVLTTATSVDLLDFESAGLHDRLQRALLNAASRPTQMTVGLISVLSSTASTLAIGVTLLVISPVLFALALLGSAPIWLFGLNSSRSLYRFAVRQTEPDRQRLYIQLLLSSRDWAKEVRAYSLGPLMLSRWQRLYAARIDDLRRVIRGRVARGILGVLLATLVLGAALVLLLYLIVHHRISLASAFASAAALILLSRQLQGLATGVASLYESALFIADFYDFTLIPVPEPAAPLTPQRIGAHAAAPVMLPFHDLEVADVGFTYPASTTPALQHVSLRLAAGEVIALVGENGSGKSTLAKLIAGLYPPTTGELRWNRQSYIDLDLDVLHSHLAVLFQDFIKFQFSVRENIVLGRPADAAHASDLEVAVAAASADADRLIASLPAGYDTQMGPQFVGGTELSGGQWQRIALARAAYRDSPVVILDEPTAALDPLAEAKLFSSTRSIFADKALILISHRFGSVRLADRIYVLSDGRLIEEGNHDELMALDGSYARMFLAQRDSLLGDA